MKVGFSGTRLDLPPIRAKAVTDLLVGFEKGEFHHGDCVGSDAIAAQIARLLGYTIVVHPPSVNRFRAFTEADQMRKPFGYLIRNQHIVDETDVLIAAPPGPEGEHLRSGTWATIRYARRTGKPVHVV